MDRNLSWGVHATQSVQLYNCATVLLLEFHGAGTTQGATGGPQLEPQVSKDAAQVEPGEPVQAGEQHQDLTSRFLGDQTQVLDQIQVKTRDL